MLRLPLAALLLACGCGLSACSDSTAPEAPPEPAPVVVRGEDPAGDVELTINATPTLAPAQPEYAQIDLRTAELQRERDGLRLVYTLDGPVGVEGYRTEVVLNASTGARSKPYRSLLVAAYLWPDRPFAGVQVSGSGDGTVQCDGEVTVSGREVVVEVPERCVPPTFRGPVDVGAGLYTDSEDSENRLAGDDLRLEGRPGLPAAP